MADLRATRTVGPNLPTPAVNVWDWPGKAKVNRLLATAPPETRNVHESTCRVPYDIVEIITAHLACDPDTLKACSLICRSWYIAAVPHLYYTLTLKRDGYDAVHGKPKSLLKLHEQGLMHLVKESRVEQSRFEGSWFVPHMFSCHNLRYLSAFANVHTLQLQKLEIYRFVPDIWQYFGPFCTTLRSVALSDPRCTPRQLSRFLSLLPNLDNIEIWNPHPYPLNATTSDSQLVSFTTLKLQGRLALLDFRWIKTWTYLIASCGLRFRHRESASCAPVLSEACSETLETFQFNTTDSKSSCLGTYIYGFELTVNRWSLSHIPKIQSIPTQGSPISTSRGLAKESQPPRRLPQPFDRYGGVLDYHIPCVYRTLHHPRGMCGILPAKESHVVRDIGQDESGQTIQISISARRFGFFVWRSTTEVGGCFGLDDRERFPRFSRVTSHRPLGGISPLWTINGLPRI